MSSQETQTCRVSSCVLGLAPFLALDLRIVTVLCYFIYIVIEHLPVLSTMTGAMRALVNKT